MVIGQSPLSKEWSGKYDRRRTMNSTEIGLRLVAGVLDTETRKRVTLTNNIGPKLDTVKANVQNKAQLDFDVEIDSVPNSLDDESGTVTATVTGSGSNCIKETGQIELKISALSTSTDSAPEITATRSISLSCVNCLNFEQPETVTPSGFIPDTGSQFGLRDEFDPKSMLSYGWESEQTDTNQRARRASGY